MSLKPPIGVAMVGVGGQAVSHLAAVEALQRRGVLKLHAVVEADPHRWAPQLEALRRAGVVVEPDLTNLLDNWRDKVSLVGVPVGIPAHRRVAVAALRAGYHVVLEKPPVGCVDDFEPVQTAAEQTDRTCAVHFQSIWLRSLRAVKAAILSGKIGRLTEIRVKGRWFREDAYYSRNNWAGRLRVNDAWVLDGTINNPFAHQVNNALFLAGKSEHAWANPVEVRAELYHARPAIFGDDTACLAVQTDAGVRLGLWLTLCSEKPERQPTIRVIGEDGRITWPLADGGGQICYADGRTESIPPDPTVAGEAVYSNVCRTLIGEDERVLCTLVDTRPFVQTVSAAYEAGGPPGLIPGGFVRRIGEPNKPGYVIDGIDEAIDGCFETGRLFSEAGVPWAHEAKGMPVGPDYGHFRPKWGA